MPTIEIERLRVYLNKVHLKGFKSVGDLTIDIQKNLNVLIGKNGAGKSNFLEFLNETLQYSDYYRISYDYAQLDFVSEDNHLFLTETERVRHAKSGQDNLYDHLELSEKLLIDGRQVYYNNSHDESLRGMIKFNDREILYRSVARGLFQSLGYKPVYPLFIRYNLPEDLGFVNLPGTLKATFIDNSFYWDFPKTLTFLQGIFWNLERYFVLDLAKLNDVTRSEVSSHLRIYNDILANLQKYTSIEDVCFNPNLNIYREEKSLLVDNVKLDFKVNGNWLPWSQLSDGTRRLFYIVSEVTFTEGIVLIEEPELGIHPHQFNLLMDFLKEQSEDKQIIISTHSPKALDHLSPDELNNILIAYYDLKKGTQIRHITEQEEKKARRYMKEVGFLSDYWLLSDLE